VWLLEKLRADGQRLALWTNSPRDRAMGILGLHELLRHFTAVVCQEEGFPLKPFRKGRPVEAGNSWTCAHASGACADRGGGL
jgi:phosphoglycolate phosphatase-like HAD superfamily hydrolase